MFESLFEVFVSGWIVEGVGDHEAGKAARCDFEASGALAAQAAPAAEPYKGPLGDPAMNNAGCKVQ